MYSTLRSAIANFDQESNDTRRRIAIKISLKRPWMSPKTGDPKASSSDYARFRRNLIHIGCLCILSFVIPGAVAFGYADRTSTVRATPCTSATAACTEWIKLGSGSARSMVYRTYSLNARNADVHRALIMIHGTNRNADHYFSTASGGSLLAGALEDTVVIAPSFLSSESWLYGQAANG